MLDIPTCNQRLWSWGLTSSKYNNCGPACLTMLHEYYTDAYVNPDRIHDETTVGPDGVTPGGHDDSHTGYLTMRQLSWWLTQRGYAHRWRYGQAAAEYEAGLRAAAASGYPVIVLQRFDRVRMEGGHFEVVRGVNGDVWTLNDPWGADARYGRTGLSETLTTAEMERYAAPVGRWWLVIERRKEEAPMRTYRDAPIAMAMPAELWRADGRAGPVNVRKTPWVGTSNLAGDYPQGTDVRVIARHTDGNGPDWYVVRIERDGVMGYVREDLVRGRS